MLKRNQLRAALCAAVLAGMPLMLTGCVAAMVGAAGAGAGTVVGSDSRTVEHMMYDEKIEQQALDILQSNSMLSNSKNFNVTVTSMSGLVLISGETTNTQYLNWCVNKIKRLEHVRKVYNYVQIKQPVSNSVMANDTFITSKIKTKLLFSDKISSGRFKVVTEDSNVYLMGFVTKDEATRAVNQVLSVSGVKKIYTIFDYIGNQPEMRNVNANAANNAQTIEPVSSTNSASSSSYVPPANAADNGGAAIIDDGASGDLLAPAQPL